MYYSQKYLDRFIQIEPFSRFCIGGTITLIVSLAWPIALLVECNECSEQAWRWIKHHLTYGLVHHVFFASAVGVFVALLDRGVTRLLHTGAMAILLILVGLAAYVSYQDFLSGYFQSYQMKDPCDYLNEELILRQEHKEREKDIKKFPDIAVKQQDYLDARKRDTLELIWKKGNVTSFVSGILTWLFITFCAVYLWYCGVIVCFNQMTNYRRLQLATVMLLLITWIPCRMYVNWYQNHFLGITIHNNQVLFAAIMATMVFGYLMVNAIMRGQVPREVAITLGGFLIAAISFSLTVFQQWLAPFSDQLNDLTPAMLISIWVVALLFIIALVRSGFESKSS